MSRYDAMFERVRARGERGAFVPFLMLGDPSPQATLAQLEALVEGDADALELGIPFSDPVADGPTIQAAAVRALRAGTTPASVWPILSALRARHAELPIGLLVYANLLEARGREAFYADAARAGVDSVLVADVPTREAEPFAAAATAAGIEPVLIAPPNAREEDLRAIARLSRGYTYVVTRRGVTGAESKSGSTARSLIEALERLDAAPPMFGFGISTPEHVARALEEGAAGAISGSAVVAIVERHDDDETRRLAELTAFTRAMKDAAR